MFSAIHVPFCHDSFRTTGWCAATRACTTTPRDAAILNKHLTLAILTLLESKPAAFSCDHVDVFVALSLDHPTSDHRYIRAATVYRVLR